MVMTPQQLPSSVVSLPKSPVQLSKKVNHGRPNCYALIRMYRQGNLNISSPNKK